MTNYIINYTEPQKITFEIIPSGYNGPGGNSSACSLRLYGRGALEWGESVDENMLRLAENFSSASFPVSAINGQLHNHSAIYWKAGGSPSTWYVFDVNAALGYGTWLQFSVSNETSAPVSTELDPIAEGTYYYNVPEGKLYRWYSMFDQVESTWVECAYVVGASAPVDGTDFPSQTFYSFNGYTSNPIEAAGWQPLNATFVSTSEPASASVGTFWFNKVSGDLKIYNGEDWNVLGGYTAYDNYDMQSTFNIINMPNQCVGSPILDEIPTHWAASIGYVQCYVAEHTMGTNFLSIFGGEMSGPINMSTNHITTDVGIGDFATNDLVSREYVDSIISPVGYTPIGTIITMPVDTEVPGYVKCDGSSYTRAALPDLYDLLITNQPFDLASSVVAIPTSGSLLINKVGHGLGQNSRVRFYHEAATGEPLSYGGIDVTIDYYVQPYDDNNFWISQYPDGNFVSGSGGYDYYYRQSLYGFGNTSMGSPVGNILDLNTIDSFNVPYMNGTFVRGWAATQPSSMPHTDPDRQLGTFQKPSLLYGDKENNSVNSVDRVADNRDFFGWDYASIDYYHKNTGDHPPVTSNAIGTTINGRMTDNNIGTARPANISMVYYIKAYDTDNVSQSNIDVSALLTQVTQMQSTLDSIVTTTKQTPANILYTIERTDGVYNFTHSLGYPSYVSVYAECVDPDLDYAIGDRVYLSTYTSESTYNSGITIYNYNNNTVVTILRTGTSPNRYKLKFNKKGDGKSRGWAADNKWTINVVVYSEIGGA